MRSILTLGTVAALGVALAACGSGDEGGDGSNAGDGNRPAIVVTTNILGDVVSEVVGDLASVEVIMPLGTDPHDFAASAKQAADMEDADLLVINGAGFEQGMDGVIDSVTDGGTPTFAFADHVTMRAEDPHLWTDPTNIVAGTRALVDQLATIDGIDAAALREQGAAYLAELEQLDADIEAQLAAVPADRRVLVTNHEVFGYYADRYGFEVVGAVIPSLTTNAETSSKELEDLAAVVAERGIPAIFAETTQSTELADALAAEVGGEVAVIELFSESLGDSGSGADTYIGMMRTNTDLIVGALADS